MRSKPDRASACVICGKPQDAAYKPFCSKRCADVDLNRWLSGGYAIPAAEEDEPEQEHKPEQKDAAHERPPHD